MFEKLYNLLGLLSDSAQVGLLVISYTILIQNIAYADSE